MFSISGTSLTWGSNGWDGIQDSESIVTEDFPGGDRKEGHIMLGYNSSFNQPDFYLPLDEGSGDIAYDVSGNENNFELIDEADPGNEGIIQSSSVETGKTEESTLETQDEIEDNIGHLSFSTWVYAEEPTGDIDGVFGAPTTGRVHFEFRSDFDDLRLRLEDTANIQSVNFPQEEWVHLAFAYDDDSCDYETYINGELAWSDSGCSGGVGLQDTTNIGHSCAGSGCSTDRRWGGYISDTKLWHSEYLSQNDVQSLEDVNSGFLRTNSEEFGADRDMDSLELTGLDYDLNGETVEVVVETDEGEQSDPITLDGGSSYDVTGLSTETDNFNLDISLETDDVTSSPVVREVGLSGESANEPPEIEGVVSPDDGEEAVGLDPDLEVDVYDEDGDEMTVTFFEGSPEEDELGTSSATNTENAVLGAENHDLGEEPGTQYEWSVEVDDGEETVESDTWSFTTVHEPEILEDSAEPRDSETVSTTPELSVDVSHEDGKEMDVYFFLEEDFVGDDQVSANGEASVDVEDTLDADESYEWYVSVEDEEGYEINNEASPWAFESDSGEVDVAVLDDSDDVNLNPYSQGVLNVEPRHSHADMVDYLRLLDGDGEVVETVEDVMVGEPVSLLWPSEDLDPNREYEWIAEAEHSGEVAQTDTASFSTIAVEVALSGDVADAEGYNIYRREESETSDPNFDYGDEDYESVGIVDELDNVIRDVSEGLGTGETYCYVATAYNVGGEGPGSDEVCMEGEVQLE